MLQIIIKFKLKVNLNKSLMIIIHSSYFSLKNIFNYHLIILFLAQKNVLRKTDLYLTFYLKWFIEFHSKKNMPNSWIQDSAFLNNF